MILKLVGVMNLSLFVVDGTLLGATSCIPTRNLIHRIERYFELFSTFEKSDNDE